MALPEGAYNFNQMEKEILNFWLSNRFYKPEYDPAKDRVLSTEEMKLKLKNSDADEKWSLICPPPNAYGRPHIGNISGYAYQDAMARYQRMKGKTVLMIPGKDHAGLEGEGVFVREVLEKQGRNKFDMTREEFYKEIWDFNMVNKEKALKDEKEIGLSADFDRDIFTLDPRIVNTVLSTFVDLYKEGMVYKGVRLINWDPKARSAIADNQCIREERDGKLYRIKYPIVNGRVWTLNFRNFKIFERIQNGEKTIETRALNPEEKERYFGEIITGDLIVCVDKTDKKSAPIYRRVKKSIQFKNIDEAFENLDWKNVLEIDNASKLEVEKAYSNISDGNLEKINTNGLVAIELEDLTDNDFITVATTRPETMFGDTAIAVNPEDVRYKDIIGKKAVIPLTNIEIPVITSPRVLTDFGTGALKITPAHSQDDFQIMNEWNNEQTKNKNENLKIGYRNVIGKDLKLTGSATGKYSGVKYKEALPQIIEELKSLNLYLGEEIVKQNILISERTKAQVEPLMSSQWFISVEKFKKPIMDMIKNGEVRIHPKNMEEKFFFWMENLRDWAISRSLWWGYRMPVWYAGEVREEIGENGEVMEYINLLDGSLVVTPPNPSLEGGSDGSALAHGETILSTRGQEGQETTILSRGDEGGITREVTSQVATLPFGGGGRGEEHYPVGSEGENNWVPLDYSNPNHILVQLEDPNFIQKDIEITLDVLRQGQTDDNLSKIFAGTKDSALNETGREQAISMAKKLKDSGVKYDLIISSPLLRAAETAKFIAEVFEREVLTDSDLIERNFGELEGLKWEEFVSKFPELAATNDENVQTNLPSGESIEQVEKRVENFISNIGNKYKGKKILVVAHSGIIRILKRKIGKQSYLESRRDDPQNLDLTTFQIKSFKEKISSNWLQDENVFDTWFSSGQWPYATLMAHNLMDTFYPANVMETGFDILENWVSRMMMFSWFKLKQIPFKDVYLHGLVQGPDGQKMAKSRGNIVDIDKVSAEYGRDAVRLAYFYQNTAGASYSFTMDKLKNFKQFNNKIWNAAKFVLQNFEQVTGNNIELAGLESINKSDNPFVKEIIKHSSETTSQVIKNIENFQFGLATFNLYQMFWHTFCDKYIEESKNFLGNNSSEAVLETDKNAVAGAMLFALKQYLKLLHPFIPFITERIWQEVPKQKDEHRALMFNRV